MMSVCAENYLCATEILVIDLYVNKKKKRVFYITCNIVLKFLRAQCFSLCASFKACVMCARTAYREHFDSILLVGPLNSDTSLWFRLSLPNFLLIIFTDCFFNFYNCINLASSLSQAT